jgi:hypothetical protein
MARPVERLRQERTLEMTRSRMLAVAMGLAVGAVGCAHCDTCDDFPAPCIGGNCGGMGGPMPGMAMAPMTSEPAAAPAPSAPAPADQPGPFRVPDSPGGAGESVAPTESETAPEAGDTPPAAPSVGPNG